MSSREHCEVDSLEAAATEVSAQGVPHTYNITLYCKQGDKRVDIQISRIQNIHDQRFHTVSLDGLLDRTLVQSVAAFLGLTPEAPPPEESSRPRSVFLAHRFDDVGSGCADKVARFLELLGFTVVSGRGYSPMSVSDKVRQRLFSQALVVALLTPGDDSTWLIQESVVGGAIDMPLIVLRERAAAFKPGILGDHEFIPFDAPYIETTFVPLMEGLRELGYSLNGIPRG